MSGRPKRACDKCTAQKLRCSGQRPSCQRCLRLRRPCSYSHESSRVSTPAGPGGFNEPLPPPAPTISQRTYHGIPSALVGPLVDTYFTHAYNASLLIHRGSFTEALTANVVRPEILLSICAFAAKFHRDANGRLSLLEDGFCVEWAERASRFAFQDAQAPREENIVLFIVLALFWYSMGQFRRSSMHECCATNTAVVLGLLTERRGKEHTLDSEMRRRRFWACYLICCFQSESLLPRSPTEKMLELSLPCRDEDFQLGHAQDLVPMKSEQSTGSLYAELVRATIMWSEVQALVKQTNLPWSTHFTSLQDLDGRIKRWWARLHCSLRISLAEAPLKMRPNLLLLHVLCHACLVALHSSIVPLFSWRPSEKASLYARQLSAQTALHHANAISSLLGAAREAQCEPDIMPSFIGYAAYCACAAQIPFLWCAKLEIKQNAHANLLMNLGVIRGIGKYWKFIELLGRNVRWLYEMHARQPVELADEPINADPNMLDGPKVEAARASLSILTHNQIIIGKSGALATGTEDVGELGMESSGVTSASGAGNPTFSTDWDCQQLGNLISIVMPSVDDAGFFNPDLSTSNLYDAEETNQIELIEDWIEELMNGVS